MPQTDLGPGCIATIAGYSQNPLPLACTVLTIFSLLEENVSVPHSLGMKWMLLFVLISQYSSVHSLRCYCSSSSHSTEVFTQTPDVTVRPHLTVQWCSLTQTPDVTVRPHLTVQRCSLRLQMLLFVLISQYSSVHSLRLQILLFVLISQYSGVHSLRCYCLSSSHSTVVFTHSDVTVRPHLTVQWCSLTQTPDVTVRPHLTVQRRSLTQMLLLVLISQYRGVHSDSRCYCSSSSHSTVVFTHSDVTVCPHLTVQWCSLTQMLLFVLISQYRGVHSLRLQMLLFVLISQYRGVHSLRCYCSSSSHSTEVFTHSDSRCYCLSSSHSTEVFTLSDSRCYC
ncbi:uncharacterized protein LOC110499728 isoform X6 [Oncorhynchus mykiss]|uniref:uncharacterized protein LOC110499728 isoform X6 n=1 Tax=Oncorhynchus mykiss TaxID=8022 RepID=UPI001877903A|nr:uncharacterized protein LOC110499728 isoform X6 [Oncorhynchus mykiss]